eukprot:IDg13202t1
MENYQGDSRRSFLLERNGKGCRGVREVMHPLPLHRDWEDSTSPAWPRYAHSRAKQAAPFRFLLPDAWRKKYADTVADALMKWFAALGVVTTWVSDRGSHFRNELIRLLKEATKASHHLR